MMSVCAARLAGCAIAFSPEVHSIHSTIFRCKGAAMANEQQFRTHTRFLATRGVSEYRASIAACVRPTDDVLELGCEWGTTTEILAPRCRSVIGTDVSDECIARARAMRPGLRFERVDAFDVRAAQALGAFHVIYLDLSGISGYRSLLDTIALLTMYATVLTPRTIVVKSGALKHFSANCTAFHG
jgi:trans-aconitate methyltransferase